MGQTLSSAAQWTSARDGAGGKLEFTQANETILNNIIGFVDGFSGAHSEESKFTFKNPITWKTELTAQDFSGGYNVQ